MRIGGGLVPSMVTPTTERQRRILNQLLLPGDKANREGRLDGSSLFILMRPMRFSIPKSVKAITPS
jgi:hypothetical protein